jgi:hypothetical protein
MITAEQIQFLKFVRAKMLIRVKIKKETNESDPVAISQSDIERFFKYNRKEQIQSLIEAGELREIKAVGKGFHKYEALKAGPFDLSLIQKQEFSKDALTQTILQNLKKVSLPEAAESTDYFNRFLRYKNVRPELFLLIDDFSGRLHTPIVSFKKALRAKILLDGEETTSIDVNTMQPLILAKVLFKAIGENEFTTWLNSGIDIYLKLKELGGLDSREKGKDKFYEITFSKPSTELAKIFGNSPWVNWVNTYKQTPNPENSKPHNILAKLLQKTEVEMMQKVWIGLMHSNIPFLTVHDEVIIPVGKAEEAELIMHEVLSKEFVFYKLSTKNKVVIPSSLSTSSTLQPEVTEKKVLFDATSSTLATLKPVIAQEIQAAELAENGNKTVIKSSWNDQIAGLEEYFATAAIPEGQVRLNVCSTITNIPAFIASHLATIKANNGNRTYLPYLNRLKEIKLHLELINLAKAAA